MNAIININSILTSVPRTAEPRSTSPTSERLNDLSPVEGDTVEWSRFGRRLARAVELSSLSVARTRAIRAQIESGTFETPERINGTVERLLDVIC